MIIQQFLKLLWPSFVLLPDDAHLTVFTLPGARSQHVPFSSEDDLEEVARVTEGFGAARREVYFGVGLRQGSPKGQGDAKEIGAWPGVWVDIDVAHPAAHKDKRQVLPPNIAAVDLIVDRVTTAGAAPTAVVHSGYGVHLYYLCDEPVVAEDAKDRAAFKQLLQRFQRQVSAAANEVGGWSIDDTAKLPQVLRLPGTVNYKVPDDPQDVQILVDDGPRHTLEHLGSVTVRGRGRPRSSSSVGASGPHPGNLFPREATGAPSFRERPEAPAEPWILDVRNRLKRLSNEVHRELVGYLLKGLPFAQEGGRNVTCYNNVVCPVVSQVCRVNPDAEPEEIFEAFFEASIEAMAEEENDPGNPALTPGDVIDQIRRSMMDFKEKIAALEEVNQSIYRALSRHNAAGRQRHTLGNRVFKRPEGREVSDEARVALDSEDVTDGGEEEDDPGVGRRLQIIQFGKVFYIWKDGRYQYPVVRDGLESHIRDKLPHEYLGENAQGEVKVKPVLQILHAASTAASRLVYDMTIQESYYDAATETFYEAVSTIRDLQPEFNEKIHTWLTLLPGDEREKFIDWLSTITDLSWQSCALYLSGPASTGKTMLAEGLSRIWSENSITEMQHALADFNDAVASCPLLIADESLPPKCTSATLRNLVASSSRTMTRKFVPGMPMRGAVRVLMLGNNDNMLPHEDEQGAFDIDATAARILHIETRQEAADYLREIGGISGTHDWVTGDLIAKHVLYLRENLRANFTTGTRFLVDGHKTRVIRMLAIRNKRNSAILEWIVRYLMNPNKLPGLAKSAGSSGGVYCAREYVMVNPTTVSEFWNTFSSLPITLTVTSIGLGMKSLSIGEERKIGTRHYRPISAQTLCDWAESTGTADSQDILDSMARLAGPVLVKED